MNLEDHKARARAALAAQPDPAFAGWTLDVVDHRPDHMRGGRSLLRAKAPDGALSLILKVYDVPGSAQAQFDALTELAKYTDSVVKPVFQNAPHNLFAMQDAGSETLLNQLYEDNGQDGTRQALTWLNGFCRDTPQTVKPFDMEPHLALAKREIEDMPERFHPAAPQVLGTLRGLFAPFHGKPMRHCTSFNDLKPENLCVNSKTGRITGIDYLPGPVQPIERDTAFLLQWIEQREWRSALKSRHRFVTSRGAGRRATAAATLGSQLDSALLDAFAYSFLINIWHKFGYFHQSADLVRTAEVFLGLRHRATLLRPSLARLIPLLR